MRHVRLTLLLNYSFLSLSLFDSMTEENEEEESGKREEDEMRAEKDARKDERRDEEREKKREEKERLQIRKGGQRDKRGREAHDR